MAKVWISETIRELEMRESRQMLIEDDADAREIMATGTCDGPKYLLSPIFRAVVCRSV